MLLFDFHLADLGIIRTFADFISGIPQCLSAIYENPPQHCAVSKRRSPTYRPREPRQMPAGPVSWGNVGVEDRRTLTAVSAEVSHADRLQRLCPLDKSNLAISAACAVQLPEGAVRSIRRQSFKGFAVEMAVFIPE